MTRILILLVILCGTINTYAGNKIKYYFTQPVNNSVAKGENAIYLNDRMGDTIVAYINRAKYTLDIAVYNYTSTFPAIAVAVNSAHSRGVRVRWIYDSSSSNTGIPLLNSAINHLASPPDAGAYSIMHNKFMIIDANSTNPNDAIVWTGSTNWNTQQFNTDYNNAVVIQDQPMAKAYRAHFNMMWGDTGIAPNPAASKFGQYKTDLGSHDFYVDGIHIEVYFSPADGTNDKILHAMGTANTDMYFGMSTFTYTTDASMIMTMFNNGVYVAGINDVSNTSYTPHAILSSGLGSSRYKIYSGSGLYHNKMLIVDPSNTCSDPLVLTGSHNWTVSADDKNDENTIIIHDATAANVFYQAFYANFTSLGGSLSSIPDCGAAVYGPGYTANDVQIFPNPSNGGFTISGNNNVLAKARIEIFNSTGQLVHCSTAFKTEHQIMIVIPGIYIVRCTTDDGVIIKQLSIQ